MERCWWAWSSIRRGRRCFPPSAGAGAYLNNRRIRVSAAKRLEDSLVSTGFPSRKRHLNVNIHFYHQMAMATHGVRRGGSAAIDLAYVAAGRLDAFWEFGLNPVGHGRRNAARDRGGWTLDRYEGRSAQYDEPASAHRLTARSTRRRSICSARFSAASSASRCGD